MSPDPLASLLSCRLLLVTGKGGVGKTTLACALARAAADRGVETVVVDLAPGSDIARLLCKRPESLPPGDGRTPVALGRHLSGLTIDPRTALQEYLEIELHFRPLASLVVSNPALRTLLDAAPGWRDLITLGKLWHLTTLARSDGVPRWPLLVVDAPSTGYGLSFISVPLAVADAVRVGPVARHTRALRELLCDRERTRVLPVTLPEELPVRETELLHHKLRELRMAAGPTLANAVESLPPLPSSERLARALSRAPSPAALPWLSWDQVEPAIAHVKHRVALQAHYLKQLEGAREPVLSLPFLARGISGPDEIAELAATLEEGRTR
ncbi:MAG: ArsA family ATPase [Myxococcota bacterium]